MRYSTDFVKKVKAEFPDYKKLHSALDAGSPTVGRYLDDSERSGMSSKQIIEAFQNGREQDVLVAAKRANHRDEMYAEWSQLFYVEGLSVDPLL